VLSGVIGLVAPDQRLAPTAPPSAPMCVPRRRPHHGANRDLVRFARRIGPDGGPYRVYRLSPVNRAVSPWHCWAHFQTFSPDIDIRAARWHCRAPYEYGHCKVLQTKKASASFGRRQQGRICSTRPLSSALVRSYSCPRSRLRRSTSCLIIESKISLGTAFDGRMLMARRRLGSSFGWRSTVRRPLVSCSVSVS
jgi:hypothetical protein